MLHFFTKRKIAQKHRRRYLVLSVIVFAIAFAFHAWNLILGWEMTLQGLAVHPLFGWLFSFVAGAMLFMGLYYILEE